MRWVLVAAGVSIAATVGRDAHAQALGASLAYRAPESCPSERDFAARLSARMGASAPTDEARRSIQVNIVQTPAGYAGTFALSGGGRRAEKRLVAPTCDELADALALVAALALRSDEPAPRDDEQHPPSQTDARPHEDGATPTPPAAKAAATSSRRPAPSGEPRPKQVDAGLAENATDSRRIANARGDRSASFGVEAGALVAAGPAPAPVVAALLGVDWTAAVDGPWELALALSAVGGAAPDVTETSGVASFRWFVGRLTACILKVSLGTRAKARACALADAGFEIARGSDTSAGVTSSRGWLAPGAGVRLEVPVADHWVLLGGGGAELPLRRDVYAFGANDFFEVPVVIGTVTASVAFFWR